MPLRGVNFARRSGVNIESRLTGMTAHAGNGHSMRETFLRLGVARETEEYRQLLAARETEDAA